MDKEMFLIILLFASLTGSTGFGIGYDKGQRDAIEGKQKYKKTTVNVSLPTNHKTDNYMIIIHANQTPDDTLYFETSKADFVTHK